MINVGLCITGSFCNHPKIISIVKELVKKYNIIPILSHNASNIDTRFGTSKELKRELTSITKNKIVDTIEEVEPMSPKGLFDIIVVAPCTGNTLAKISNAITDTTVTMAVKSHIRNYKPVVIALATNDGLGFTLQNIGKLLNSKSFYFVPFEQDNYSDKPKSLVCDFDKLQSTIELALNGEQIQPIIVRK